MQPTTDEKEAMLAYRANKAAERSFYLASAIKSYQERNQLDRVALANWLDVTDGQLTRLELCGMPDSSEPKRSKDIADIAGKVRGGTCQAGNDFSWNLVQLAGTDIPVSLYYKQNAI